MKRLNNSGFTIIETMLFLGITALLIMGVLTNVGSSINVQRYRDSVSSLQSILQKQFSEVANVNNTSDGSLQCNGATEARGQSDCVILGRYITTTDSKVISMKGVVGHINSGASLSLDDVSALQQYNIEISPITGEEYEVEWGASLVGTSSEGSAPKTFSILILRSPSSGAIRTFIDSDSSVSDNNIPSLLDRSNLSNSVKMCIDSNGLFGGGLSSVVVNAYATNASSVESQGEAMSGC